MGVVIDRTTAPYIVGTFFLKILMHTKPAVCFLALGCELRYNTADRARARARIGVGLGLRLGLGLGLGRMPLCTQVYDAGFVRLLFLGAYCRLSPWQRPSIHPCLVSFPFIYTIPIFPLLTTIFHLLVSFLFFGCTLHNILTSK